MNDKIRELLTKRLEAGNWFFDEDNMLEELREAKTIHKEEVANHRWWSEHLYVVNIDGMLISYVYARANRDESVEELGWEFDWNSVQEMQAIEKTITVYEPSK